MIYSITRILSNAIVRRLNTNDSVTATLNNAFIMNLPYSAAAEQNRTVICEQLKAELKPGDRVLEIGSGTGQHVSYFAQQFPEVSWQPSDIASVIPFIDQRVAQAAASNVLSAVALDVRDQPWAVSEADVVYSANTLHIMSAASCECLIRGCAAVLPQGGRLCVYGPFSVDGHHTSESNHRFDQMLKAQDPASGVRDLTELDRIAVAAGFSLSRRTAMPANNLFVVWDKTSDQ
ncbi:MAG: DUF938 domain-containing protein [Granulosicoccus sp.]|nr:DUF938 domain-containing protein [Granulosicoccus sp.]